MASRSWNKVELLGNLTRDPELRYTPSGAAVCTFSIATNRVFITDGERKEEADFHRCVAWNKLAELCNQLLKKGNRVFVSGRLQNRSWQDAQGETKYMTEVVIEDMILLTSRNIAESGSEDNSVDMAPPEEELIAADNSSKGSKRVKEEDSTEEAGTREKKETPAKDTETVSDEDLPF